MKKGISVLAVFCLALSLISFGTAESAWKGFRGLDWGAVEEEILQTEKAGEPQINRDALRTESGQAMDMYSYTGASVSRYSDCVDVGYLAVDRRLVLTTYHMTIARNTEDDYAFLREELIAAYGSPSGQGPEYAAPLFASLGVPSLRICDICTVWEVEGTVILLQYDREDLYIICYGKAYAESSVLK